MARNYGVEKYTDDLPNPVSFTIGFWSGSVVGGIAGMLFTLIGVWLVGLIF